MVLLGVLKALLTDSQAEGRRFAAKLCLAAQASEACSRSRSRAPLKSTTCAIAYASQLMAGTSVYVENAKIKCFE
jgi:hypothetical protein